MSAHQAVVPLTSSQPHQTPSNTKRESLKLGGEGRKALIKRLREFHEGSKDLVEETLLDQGLKYGEIHNATLPQLFKMAYVCGLWEEAVQLHRDRMKRCTPRPLTLPPPPGCGLTAHQRPPPSPSPPPNPQGAWPHPLVAQSYPPTAAVRLQPTGGLPPPQAPQSPQVPQTLCFKQLRGLDDLSRVLRSQLQLVDKQRQQAFNLFATPNKPQAVEQNLRVWQSLVDNQATKISPAVKALTYHSAKKIRMIQALLETPHEPCLEGIPEVLWLSDGYRTGIGGYLGFVACVKSLSGVSTAIASIVGNPKMHPILLLDNTTRLARRPPPIHKKWKEVLSRASSIRVLIEADPRVISVALLEAAAPAVTEITVDTAAERTTHRIEIAGRNPVSIPRLVRAVLTREWVKVMQRRRQHCGKQLYEMPALTHLSVEWPYQGGLTMLKGVTGGLRSLHLLDKVGAGG
mmetsp:Transcript_19791/g.56826  ORF Transcript_19791/g.56826 Transcript_19791/m.56826 type:complete len:459 (-) Transcript_19791:539-1915(-)